MRTPAAFLGCLLTFFALAGAAVERVQVCFNYGCLAEAEVTFDAGQLEDVRRLLVGAPDAAGERAVIGTAIGRLLGWAGRQSPIAADKGGNFADDGAYGRMDCIDHSTTTTRLLRLLEARGWLRFHRVLDPALRLRFLFFQHYSALIEETSGPGSDAASARYAVDSWFLDNGQPAMVMPLDVWLAGGGPNVGE